MHSETISKKEDESNKANATATTPELVPNPSQLLLNFLPSLKENLAPIQDNEAPTKKEFCEEDRIDTENGGILFITFVLCFYFWDSS
ncbi:hypothetical protein B9Z55_027894 [Caenorhabditis nigoni]|nr:hypothetical protein B9Z55_027894 [Caenorhabditis nigoni]